MFSWRYQASCLCVKTGSQYSLWCMWNIGLYVSEHFQCMLIHAHTVLYEAFGGTLGGCFGFGFFTLLARSCYCGLRRKRKIHAGDGTYYQYEVMEKWMFNVCSHTWSTFPVFIVSSMLICVPDASGLCRVACYAVLSTSWYNLLVTESSHMCNISW